MSVRASIAALEGRVQHLEGRVSYLEDARDERLAQARRYEDELNDVERDIAEIKNAIQVLSRSAAS